MNLNALTTDVTRESDACGIFSWIEKTRRPSHAGIHAGLDALKALRHRAGYVGNEGDGSGLMLDIPVKLWKGFFQEAGRNPGDVDDPQFFVGHLFINMQEPLVALELLEDILAKQTTGYFLRLGDVDDSALGRVGRSEAPLFYQIAGRSIGETEPALFQLRTHIQAIDGIHLASLSHHHVVYKVIGDGEALEKFYGDLTNPLCEASLALAHTRFSTNTKTSFSKVQPFQSIAHNGEINTIYRFFSEATMAGIPIDPMTSDSGMLDALLQNLCSNLGWTLFEVMELMFPPIPSEIKRLKPELRSLYHYLRSLWGPFSQGPAGVMAIHGPEAVFSVDALGLRPLWYVETKHAYCFSSEQGIVPAEQWTTEPIPLGPGEKVGVTFFEKTVEVSSYSELQSTVHQRMTKRISNLAKRNRTEVSVHSNPDPSQNFHRDFLPAGVRAAAFGWNHEDMQLLKAMSSGGKETIQSLGHDAPLAALDSRLRLVSDFLHESVAVVTNPAIDREREAEHFSTQTLLGRRPSFSDETKEFHLVETNTPLLLDAIPNFYQIAHDELERSAARFGSALLTDVLASLRQDISDTYELWIHRAENETTDEALLRLASEAKLAAFAGAKVIILNDRHTFTMGQFIDPILATAAVHKALFVPESTDSQEYIRRRLSLILRSASLRNLHDVVVSLGVGADAVVPYFMWELAASESGIIGVENLLGTLSSGIEKVISTLGIHECRGYERMFSGIGLKNEIAEILGVPNFCGTKDVGYGFEEMDSASVLRKQLYVETSELGKTPRTFRLYPRIWKAAGQVATSSAAYQTFVDRLKEFEVANPTSLRHLLEIATGEDVPISGAVNDLDSVNLSVGEHSLPFIISSMSFGSQNETAFRAYAMAARQLDMIAMSGEGGEIPDMLEAYPRHRGRQVASGRFGVNAAFVNNAYVVEIKIGQGAKPGEGGHLPGSKVTEKVAIARNASVGVDLISPSNNHDIYSIEDLAQVIFEIKQVNPSVKVAVKVPVVPNIGTISVGIAKAGADIISLSGFDGGTGAARAHAIRHVGLPIEIGISRVHQALTASGLRNTVEIWADGGMKSGEDAMKAILLGANRIGFGTMAMVAIGCTACRGCHKDTCHVGIATQVEDMEEAHHKGMTAFQPRELNTSVERLSRFFSAIAAHMASITRALGASRVQELVGKADLLVQSRGKNLLDVHELLVTQTDLRVREAVSQVVSSGVESASEICETFVVGAEGIVTTPAMGRIYQTNTTTGSVGSIVTVDRRGIGLTDSGNRIRRRNAATHVPVSELRVGSAGLGFAAYHTEGMASRAYGGADDGVGKCASGGLISVVKVKCHDGRHRGGSVGKGLGYGAQSGLFIVQGVADTRAGIRLSGADMVIGGDHGRRHTGYSVGELRSASIKGFGFEYMTRGRGLVLGDPGPWLCSGMTGGSVYLECDEPRGLSDHYLRTRLAKGAKVQLSVLDDQGVDDVLELLHAYQAELRQSGQGSAAKQLARYVAKPREHFRMVRPHGHVTDQTIATE